MSIEKMAKNKDFLDNTISVYPVIVKGFRGCPDKLNAKNVENSLVTVIGRSGKTEMRLKVKYVYQFDEGIYQRLKKAYDAGDTETLAKEWQCAKPITVS